MEHAKLSHEDALALVLDELRGALARSEAGAGVAAEESTKLMGSQAPLDSVAFVSLIIGLERELELRCGRRFELADGRAMSHRPSPFRNAGTLASYIVELVSEAR